jgi:S1-C subfamily serine protease
MRFSRSIVMTVRWNRFQARLLAITLGIVLGLAGASIAHGQGGRLDLAPLIAKIKPSVALIQVMEKGKLLGTGSGFVVDAKGMIATNYHVVEGAKELLVSFPADKNKKSFSVKGFVGILPGKDMALIMIEPGDKQLTALPLAKSLPSQGEPVVAFGAPLGLSDTVTDGIVSAVREGADLRDMLKRGDRDDYKDSLGYDLDIHWIQTSAPISPGNSGGPLVNSRGEVVGINSFVSQMGQNLNFSLSTLHLQDLINSSGTTVQPLASLPEPRKGHAHIGPMGDPAVTLNIWKQFNRIKNTLGDRLADAESQLDKIPSIDSRLPQKYQNVRNKKVAKIYKEMAKDYADHAAKLKTLKSENADPELIITIVAEANISEKLGVEYKRFADDILHQGGSRFVETVASVVKQYLADISTHHDVLRVNLSRKYGKDFPTLDETSKESTSTADVGEEKKDEKAANGDLSKDSEKLGILRVWTDSSGKHKLQAKYRGMEDGKVMLEKPDGKMLHIPPASLSEKDRRFLGVDE